MLCLPSPLRPAELSANHYIMLGVLQQPQPAQPLALRITPTSSNSNTEGALAALMPTAVAATAQGTAVGRGAGSTECSSMPPTPGSAGTDDLLAAAKFLFGRFLVFRMVLQVRLECQCGRCSFMFLTRYISVELLAVACTMHTTGT